MAVKPKVKRRGRPPISPEQRKRNNVTLRLRDELKQKLEKGARATGRSLSEEMEFRLEQSSASDDEFGGAEYRSIFQVLGAAAKFIERRTGKDFSDWEARNPYYKSRRPGF